MKRFKAIYALFLFLGAYTSAQGAETAQSVLKHAVERMSTQPVQATFDLQASGMSQKGMITLHGNRFAVITADLSTWYDGKTQWTLVQTVKEVNVTEPSREELAETNPLLILGSLSSDFNAEMAGSGTGAYEILLVARDNKTGIASARVKVNASTWFPSAITLHTSTGEQYDIEIKSIKNLNSVPPETFRYNPSAHPGVEVIDMR